MKTEPRGLLITGTDTGVGKTLVACGLAGAFRRRGFSVAPFKPAETGCLPEVGTNRLVAADAELLRRACGTAAPLETICPYRFALPLAPWVAAEQAGVSIDPARLERCYHELAASHDAVLVETAGGIVVPLSDDFHYADLARRFCLPVLVVIGSKLGAINHARLTLEFVASAGLATIACVLNHPFGETNDATDTNEVTLRRLTPVPLFVIPHRSNGIEAWDDPVFDPVARHVEAGLLTIG
jgi:dethiobiotin synthetase